MDLPMIIAHRGASALAVENTIESFRKAIDLGADMIEFDVRRTKDKVFVVYHDKFLHGKLIAHLTYDEIEESSPSIHPHIHTLEEILEFARGRTKIDVDMKEGGYEHGLMELLLRHVGEDECIITCSVDSSVRIVKNTYPTIKVGLIVGKRKPERFIRTKILDLFPIHRCIRAGADFLVAHFRLITSAFLEKAERNYLPVYVWTVNDEGMISQFLHEKRVRAIITDRPDRGVALKNKIFSTG